MRSQFGPYTGSFDRSLQQETHWLEHLNPNDLLVAIDPADQVRGYLFFAVAQARGPFFLAGTHVWELAVDDWPATVALLQHHAQLMEGVVGHGAPAAVLYSVPPTSAVAVSGVRENLEVTDIATWELLQPLVGRCVSRPSVIGMPGWMARLVCLPALTRAMLPEWQARWQRSLARWSGDVSLMVVYEENSPCVSRGEISNCSMKS